MHVVFRPPVNKRNYYSSAVAYRYTRMRTLR